MMHAIERSNHHQEHAVANWERKDADTLAHAIDRHCSNKPHLAQDNELLSIVRIALDQAANTVNTTASTLRRHRAVVCAICRGSQLYACDVADGWSESCALIYMNTEGCSSVGV